MWAGNRDGIIRSRGIMMMMMLLRPSAKSSHISYVQAKSSSVNAPVTPDEERTKDRLGQEIKNAVEDCLGVGSDDVAAFAYAPGDRVENPKEGGQGTAIEVSTADVGADVAGVLAGGHGELPHDEKEGSTAEGIVTPLVAGLDQSANEASDDHDFVDKHKHEDRRPGHSSSEQQVQQEQRGGDNPINVASIENSTIGTGHLGVTAVKLNWNRGHSQVGAHSEIGNAGDHADSSGDIVEDTLSARLPRSKSEEHDGGKPHKGADGEIEVGAMGGDSDVGEAAVDKVVIDVDSVIALFEIHVCHDFTR